MAKILRGAIVGASTLLGKELAEELSSSKAAVWDVTLLDTAEAGGQITSAGDEALVIQTISAESFARVDVAFFAADAATTRKHWKAAHAAGASIVDLTGALEGQPGVIVRSPWVSGAVADLTTVAIVSAHPAAIMLAVVIERLKRSFSNVKIVATMLEPASQQDSAGLDELHQQTVGLLSFQAIPKDIYDAQVAFSLRSALGGAAKMDLAAVEATVRRQLVAMIGADTANAAALRLLQAPVFHGYTGSVFVQVREADEEALGKTLKGAPIEFDDDAAGPSNDSVAGKGEIAISVKADVSGDGLWLWMAADNLRLAASNAAACGVELAAFRPASGVQ